MCSRIWSSCYHLPEEVEQLDETCLGDKHNLQLLVSTLITGRPAQRAASVWNYVIHDSRNRNSYSISAKGNVDVVETVKTGEHDFGVNTRETRGIVEGVAESVEFVILWRTAPWWASFS